MPTAIPPVITCPRLLCLDQIAKGGAQGVPVLSLNKYALAHLKLAAMVTPVAGQRVRLSSYGVHAWEQGLRAAS